MSLEIKNGELPPELSKLILGGSCVAFIGSGPSTFFYDPWHDLVNRLCRACGLVPRFTLDSPTTELSEGAQLARDSDPAAYVRCLRDHFCRYTPYTPRLYELLLSVRFKCYLTVAFDLLLVRQARTRDASYRWHTYPDIERGHVVSGPSIVHLHGHIGDDNESHEPTIVLTKDQFNDAYEDNGVVSNLLVPTLENDPVVFIGCRLEEPVMPRVFAICKRHQQRRLKCQLEQGTPASRPPRRYILLPFPMQTREDGSAECNTVRQAEDEERYLDMDIETVWYPPDDYHSLLAKAFENLAGYRQPKPVPSWGQETSVV